MSDSWFDNDAFFQAVDAERQARGLRWKEVAAEAGVSASTLTRLGQGRRPDVDSLAALTIWAGIEADGFFRGAQRRRAAPLSRISMFLRSDPNLSRQSARLIETIVKSTYEELRER
jgi:transcriptional regulator with XRE-family HTH domain